MYRNVLCVCDAIIQCIYDFSLCVCMCGISGMVYELPSVVRVSCKNQWVRRRFHTDTDLGP